jgi:hypothetical protein
MTLSPGTKLGPYEILAPIGAGGMGEVYRARDSRLGRDVAVKVLPDSVSADPERLRRFEQEARSIAALNHPNILAVHDIGTQDGTRYIVTELLEGETLREKLSASALPQRKSIDYSLQVATGLAAAHDKGIVHRDLKPENLFITRDGRVKILDFGLAKTRAIPAALASSSAPDATIEASVGVTRTAEGVMLGTVGYMSPEQVKGEPADSRSDIFSFGAVLYESLSGRRPFQRDSSVETMSAILKEDPPEISSATNHISPGVGRIVRRCLEKDPGHRFQSAKDLAFALETMSGSSSQLSATALPAAAAPASHKTTWLIPALVVAAFALAAFAYVAGKRAGDKPAKFEQLTFQRGYIKGARFMPGGQNIVYSAMWEGRAYEVFTSRIGDVSARSLDLKNAMMVGVSESGDLALLTDVRRLHVTSWMQLGTLSRAPASGGVAREILNDVWDADISRDGTQFAVVRSPDGPQQLEYPIGKVLYRTNGWIGQPRISPDGKSVAFIDHPIFGDERGVTAIAFSDGNVQRLTPDAASEEGLAWKPDGSEVWYGATEQGASFQNRVVFAVTPSGKIRKVFSTPDHCMPADIAADGRLLFSHETLGSAQLVASPANSPEHDVSAYGYANSGVISADGESIAFTEAGSGSSADYSVYFRRLDGSRPINLGDGSTSGLTPDGKFVVAQVPSQPTKLRVLPTGAGEARTFDLAPINIDRDYVSWLPGGKDFEFLGHEGTDPPHPYRFSINGGQARPLMNQKGAHFWNRVSPDGKYVLQAPGAAGNWQVQTEIVDIATGEARHFSLQLDENPIGWDQDNRHVFVVHENGLEATIFRVDAFTGQREVWKQIRVNDPSGILSLTGFFVTPSGNAYGYTSVHVFSALYIYSR